LATCDNGHTVNAGANCPAGPYPHSAATDCFTGSIAGTEATACLSGTGGSRSTNKSCSTGPNV
jgi:hypothetical protein